MELGPYPIKGLRTSWGYRQEYMAQQLGISLPSYRKKEAGDVRFNDREKIKVAEILRLSPQEMNLYLYEGALPISKEAPAWDEPDFEFLKKKPDRKLEYSTSVGEVKNRQLKDRDESSISHMEGKRNAE